MVSLMAWETMSKVLDSSFAMMRSDAMQVFIEYEVAKAKYLLSQAQYDEVLTEIERLFQMTQPSESSLQARVTSANRAQ